MAQQKILIIKLGALGDFIQALGPMRAIRAHHPQAHITLLTTQAFESLARQSGYCNDIWIDEKPSWINVSGWHRLKKQLNAAGFDRVYDLQNNDRTALYLRLFARKARPEWVGAAPGASHRNDSPQRTAGHALAGHIQTLALAGISGVTLDALDWLQADLGPFPLRRPFILLVPGSSPGHPHKRWPAQSYARLAKVLSSAGYQIVLLGTRADDDVIRDILKECPQALDLCGQTQFAHLAALARHAAAAIGNDTGPLHLIAATGCPVLALFSSASNPQRHGPQGPSVQILQESDLKFLSVEKVMEHLRPREQPPKPAATMH